MNDDINHYHFWKKFLRTDEGRGWNKYMMITTGVYDICAPSFVYEHSSKCHILITCFILIHTLVEVVHKLKLNYIIG